jgi:two-component system phosphate regulon response regulator PhoB
MARDTILIVEDERDIAQLIAYNLSRQGYETQVAPTAEAALTIVNESPPDLVILDIMLPGMSGLELCRRLKRDAQTRSIPVVMLTARSQDSDIVAGLEAGADDYVTKPFSPRVLVARMRAVFRRASRRETGVTRICVHDLAIDIPKHEISCAGTPLALSATEFELLLLLSQSPGRVFSRAQIISSIKGHDYPVTERSVDVQIVGIRRKLGLRAGLLETVRGVGYRMKEPEPEKAE